MDAPPAAHSVADAPPRRRGWGRLLIALTGTLALGGVAACGGASRPAGTTTGTAPHPATAAARPTFAVALRAPGHHPRVNRPFPITVTVRPSSGAPLSGSVRYEFLFGGQVVSRQPGGPFRNGVYHDTLTFPARSLGFPITLRVVVTTRLGTRHVDYAVASRR